MKCPLLKETEQTKANCQKDYLTSVIGTNPARDEEVRRIIRKCKCKESAESKEKTFPMQGGPAISMSLAAEIYKKYSDLYGTSQSLERLGERGGFGWSEIESLYRMWHKKYSQRSPTGQSIRQNTKELKHDRRRN